jgi:hypothetical protein
MSDFNAEEWLEVAEVCCDRIVGVDQEALLRTALNRAYYAALLCVSGGSSGYRGAALSRSHVPMLQFWTPSDRAGPGSQTFTRDFRG